MSNLMEAGRQWSTRPQDERFQTVESLKNFVLKLLVSGYLTWPIFCNNIGHVLNS